MDMTEPIDFIKNLEARGASYFVETIGNPTITISYVEADRDHEYMTFMHAYFANLLKKICKPETSLSALTSLRSGWQKHETGRDESSRHGAIRVRGQMHSRRCDGHGGPRPAVLADPLTRRSSLTEKRTRSSIARPA